MKKILLILICIPTIVFGQYFQTNIINSLNSQNALIGRYVQQTSDGGYVCLGDDGDDYGIQVTKTDEFGSVQWQVTYEDTIKRNHHSYCLKQTTDGGYIIPATLGSYDTTMLIKINSNGVEQWSRILIADDLRYIEETSDGGYVITGSIRDISGGNGYSKILLIKADVNGNEQWRRTFDQFGRNNLGHSVQQTADGGYIIGSESEKYDYNTNSLDSYIYLIKTDVNGNLQWDNTFFYDTEDGFVAQQTTDGGYIIIGSGWDNTTSLIKTDMYGIETWSSIFTSLKFGSYIRQTIDGGYIGIDSLLVKTDSQGNLVWQKNYDGQCVKQTIDGGYIFISFRNANKTGYYLTKTDDQGNVTSISNILMPSSNKKLQDLVDILGKETNGKTNEPLLYIYDDGTVEKKIIIE